MHARVLVRKRAGVKDPEGDAIRGALESLDFTGVGDVRIGKVIDLEIDAPNDAAAREIVEEMAKRLLANPVMERFTVEILSTTGPS